MEQPSKSPTPKLESRFASSALKYFLSLDKTTQRRIKDKIAELEKDPQNIRTSKPLKGAEKRSARVGSYRILFLIEGDILLVSDIGPRGQVYRKVCECGAGVRSSAVSFLPNKPLDFRLVFA